MANSIDKDKKAEKMAAVHSGVNAFILSVIVELMAVSKKGFAAVNQALFMVNWVNETFALLWQTISYRWSYNKNMEKTGSLIFDWLKFTFSTFLLFGSILLVSTAQIGCMGASLILTPLISLAKGIYYLAKTIQADNPKEAEAHFAEVKSNLISAMISGFLGLCIATLIYVALPVWATILIASIVTLVILPPIVQGLGTQIYETLGSWVNSLGKLWRKHQGLQGPGNQYDLKSGATLDNDELAKNIIYVDELKKDFLGDKYLKYRIKDESGAIREGTFKQYALPDDKLTDWPKNLSVKELNKLKPHFDSFADSLLKAKERTSFSRISNILVKPEMPVVPFKPVLRAKAASKELPQYEANDAHLSDELKNYHAKERQQYHAHLSAPALNSVEELVAEAARQIHQLTHHSDSFFQGEKRQHKIESLQVLVRAVSQWNDLYQTKNSNQLSYHSIVLDDQTEISRILNPNLDMNVSANRETVIKRIEQHILGKYPEAYQSFFRGQGSVATLFQQGFDLMRRMKTDQELNQERKAIIGEIEILEAKYAGMKGYFVGDEQKTEYLASIKLLRDFLNGSATAQEVNENAELKASQKGSGTRWQLCQKILAYKESEKLFFKEDNTQEENLGVNLAR